MGVDVDLIVKLLLGVVLGLAGIALVLAGLISKRSLREANAGLFVERADRRRRRGGGRRG